MKPLAYPNPFRQETTVEFTIPVAAQTSLALTDEYGKVLREETKLREAGRQQIMINAENLPEGIYYYKIRINNEIKTIRLMKTR
ncbi:T9SS type A sorting domain-containing protein [Dyadobacter sp. CY326]|uniref:T9SS type A sorting domain-containing protein n=1 Tax=Dyadobacter sp. CY326 TaxID=2907300 RepID=UPI001F399C2D|nr:T9SS type A sorting domain-containing protein [Dyadobacter sp. CY326]MCE7063863.1 T9SS type A sorting domain-containing protein [Dyadobacter sp. CY326]